MSPELQRIKIAEACGWTVIDQHKDLDLPHALEAWTDGIIVRLRHELPDYLKDLNAMNEAEKVIWRLEKAYIRELINIKQTPEDAIFATASQRAEAFLKTIGKWKG